MTCTSLHHIIAIDRNRLGKNEKYPPVCMCRFIHALSYSIRIWLTMAIVMCIYFAEKKPRETYEIGVLPMKIDKIPGVWKICFFSREIAVK